MPHGGRAHRREVIRPRTRQRRINYEVIGQKIAFGAFGKVYRTRNTDTGVMMAMKVVSVAGQPNEEDHLTRLKNEVDVLARSRHDHIVKFITSEGWSRSVVRIFMTLKDGTLGSLALQSSSSSIRHIYKTALDHMLQALDYLAAKDIMHRDMKPDNVLYSTVQGRFHFQLGDFGLAAEAGNSRGYYGTPIFMAPEVIYGDIQTAKLDVWSLYVSMVWVLDDQGFREKCLQLEINRGAERLFQGISNLLWPIPTRLRNIQDMIKFDASSRASAGDMLEQLYQGRGRTTAPVDPPRQNRAPRRERPHREIFGQERPRRQERDREPSPFSMNDLGWAIDVDIEAQRRELERYQAAMRVNDEPRRPAAWAPDLVGGHFGRDSETCRCHRCMAFREYGGVS